MKKYKSEEEFLKDYDSSIFEKLSLTTDILIFSVSDEQSNNYRKVSKKHFSILLIKRYNYPYKNKWCLPGGFVNIDESIDDATKRVLSNETNLHNIYLEQLYTFGNINRDPRMRVISTAYMALVNKNMLKDKLLENAKWFNIEIKNNDILLKNDNLILNIDKDLAFDHNEVIKLGITRLKNKIEYTDIVFNMMPKYFTLKDLQSVYEVILNKKLLDPAFRRIINKKVIKTNKMRIGEGHRPSSLFMYNNN